MKLPAGLGGSSVFLAVRVGDPWGLAARDGTVWYTLRTDGSVRACDAGGCERDAGGVTVAAGQVDPRGLAVTADALFWADFGRGIVKLAR
jgi:hypothetical protein